MTVREFASKSKKSVILKIISEDRLLTYFDTDYWQYVTDDVLDLEIEQFQINNQLMKRAEVEAYVTSDLYEDDSGQEEPQGDTEPEEDPADDPYDEDPADNLGGDLDDDDGEDGDDE